MGLRLHDEAPLVWLVALVHLWILRLGLVRLLPAQSGNVLLQLELGAAFQVASTNTPCRIVMPRCAELSPPHRNCPITRLVQLAGVPCNGAKLWASYPAQSLGHERRPPSGRCGCRGPEGSAQRTPSHLWLCRLSRQAGWARTKPMASS